MIIKEKIDNLIKTYSDEGFYIRKVGTEEVYAEALDILEFDYEETEEKIQIEEEAAEVAESEEKE
jgi:hypothetical protein